MTQQQRPRLSALRVQELVGSWPCGLTLELSGGEAVRLERIVGHHLRLLTPSCCGAGAEGKDAFGSFIAACSDLTK